MAEIRTPEGVMIRVTSRPPEFFLRRHFVAWSDLTRDTFPEDYWPRLYGWFDRGGDEIVADYLGRLDLSGFDPKAPPPKTQAFWEIVDASRSPEDAEMADALDGLRWPATATIAEVIAKASSEFGEWLRDRKNARRIPHRFEECGYVPVRNPDATDGLWKIGGRACYFFHFHDGTDQPDHTGTERASAQAARDAAGGGSH